MRYSSDCARWSQIGIVAGQMKPHSRPRLRLPYGFNRPARPRWRSKEELNAAVIIAPVGRDDSFVADFAPIILIEKILDAGENTESPIPKFHFRGQIPNVIGRNETLEGITVVAKFVIHHGAEQRDFDGIFVAIDPAGLELIIRRVSRRVAVIWPGREFGVQHRDVAVEQEVPVWTGGATADQRQNVQFGRGFKSDVTRIADVAGGSKTVRQNDIADLIFEIEIETADVKTEIWERLSANSIFKLKRIALLEVAIYHAAWSGWHQFAVRPWPVGLRYCAVKFNTRRTLGRDCWRNYFL